MSPACNVCICSPVTLSVVVALGDSMLVTLASGPERPSASVIVLFSNSAQSIATSEVLASIRTAKIMGVNLLIVISSKRVGVTFDDIYGIYELAKTIRSKVKENTRHMAQYMLCSITLLQKLANRNRGG